VRLHVLLVDRLDYLSKESFFSSLKKIKAILALAPDIPGGLELRGRRSHRGNERGYWEGCDPRNSISQGGIALRRHDEAKVAIETSTKGRGNRSGVGLQLLRKSLETLIRGLATKRGKDLVRKVDFLDIRDANAHHGG
jgi:hypothetical protein